MALINCPICQKPFETEQSPALPFCSQRCRLVDLGRWFGEQYGLEGQSEEEDEAEGPEREP
jgi:uncharacterized protein